MRVVLTTFGSLGDLHPYLAVGLGLRARGHEVLVATSEVYRERVIGAGLEFAPVRPDLAPFVGDEEIVRRVWAARTGTEYLIREMVMPHLEDSYEDLMAACAGADVLVTHMLLYAAPLVAEVMGIPAVGVGLQPIAFLSSYDPPVLGPAQWTYGLRHLGRTPFRVMFWLAERRARGWARPIEELRGRLGLKAARRNPLMYSAEQGVGTMAWFSGVLGRPQVDWPANTVVTGFPFYESGQGLTEETEAFLQAGEAPVVFTLGSAAVQFAGRFYEESAAAARLMGRRAVLLVGDGRLRELASETVHVAAYEPYGALFPRAAVVVHQCGIGTTAECLRAGVSMLGVPWGHDQFDNAERIRKAGCGLVLAKGRYKARRVAEMLGRLVAGECAEGCGVAWVKVQGEDGVRRACEYLEGVGKGIR
jgi:UDP:flavonoid glycosyltransferase YjiC (YdhE family)